MKRAEVSGIRVELPTTSPVLLLRIEGGVTHVPIWIGSPEASMIALFAEGVDSPRPLTHDLVLDVAGAAGRSLERVEITALRDDVYEASLVFDDGGRVDSRASDAVALAMRASVDILIADAIVDEVGVQVADEQEEEVEKFREFLDHVSAEDFEEPEE
ncbi:MULTISPECIES: bifunctional nuclease family protein [Dermacoccus]|uniref:Bifunctional nuclease family protein n=2 Tax=Dermacoccus TaxID=57495 RepID=A0A417Z6A2_9MICO|nr:bifunctional nuclease family protein [Dermacoccus abyssi]RHW46141.1 bifunctional nuclease family protein [Dermacoccus abyssi]